MQVRVAELGSLSSGAKMAMKIFCHPDASNSSNSSDSSNASNTSEANNAHNTSNTNNASNTSKCK